MGSKQKDEGRKLVLIERTNRGDILAENVSVFERGVVSDPGRDPRADLGKRVWEYGMRLRGYSPGCQPGNGLIEVKPGTHGYHNILVYDRELTDEEVREYELDIMGVYAPHDVFKVTRIKRGVQPQSVCTDWSGEWRKED